MSLENLGRQLRKWATEAYERQLHRELRKLEQHFEAWRQGEISSGELSHRIHQYETGPSRELYKQYNYGEDDMNVAYAIVVGILDKEEVSEVLMDALSRQLAFYRSIKSRGDLKLPE